MTLTVPAPENVTPVPLELVNQHKSKSAARKAKAAATRVERYCYSDFSKFATPFAAAIASASAEKGRPVSLNEVITAIAETGCKVKISKYSKDRFAWNGLKAGRWQISREMRNPSVGGVQRGSTLVAYPKDTAMPSRSRDWRFSPSPAARGPLVELSCEPSPRSSAGCVVC